MMEEPLFFPSHGFRLFGVLHRPQPCRPLGLVLCAPFAEEHKQGYRVFAELARRLAAEGLPCLRFDYRGTGDSEGPFSLFSPSAAIEDIRAAAELLRQRTEASALGLVGLRLGASLAWQAAEQGLEATHLVLWQPIADGALFYRLNLRRMLVRQMMMHGKARSEAQEGEGESIDLGGFPIRRSACEEIKGIDLRDRPRPPAPSLLVQFAHSPEPSGELKPLVEALGPRGRFVPLVLEPFWNRIGYVDCSPAIEATAAWLGEQAEA
ncbi:MAG: serine aminopeptidase domain-containing protein [Candidatus Brocadiia bacterium]